MIENYKGARTLATVTHLGETFRIVRQRINGKPWRKYLALLHDDMLMSRGDRETDPQACAVLWADMLAKAFTTRDDMLARIAWLNERTTRGIDVGH